MDTYVFKIHSHAYTYIQTCMHTYIHTYVQELEKIILLWDPTNDKWISKSDMPSELTNCMDKFETHSGTGDVCMYTCIEVPHAVGVDQMHAQIET